MNPNTLCVGCMDDDSGEPICPKCGRAFDLAPKNTLQLRPRTLLHDQYLIGRALGHGGFGITYLAWDTGLEARLAIKEYMPNGVAGRASNETKVLAYSEATQQEFNWGLDRFLEEARVLKKFNSHPGIVSVDTIFRDNGTAYLVMEYLDGMTFEEFLNRRGGKITFETALRVMLPVLDALSAVHAEGILHRDISPDNIYLTRDGKIKLIDFGAARNALSQKSRNLSIILKEGYAPEEQYRASGVQGPWTDVYACAATLYHAVTGRIPPPSLDRQAEDTLQRPAEFGAELEPHAEASLMKALAIRAGDRFQSMEDFKGALTGEINVVEATRVISAHDPRLQALNIAPPPPPPPPARPPTGGQQYAPPPPPPPAPIPMPVPVPRPKPRWLWPAVLGAAAVLAVVVVALRPPDDGDQGKKGDPIVVANNDNNGNPNNGGPNGNPGNDTPSNGNPGNGGPSNGNPNNGNPSNGGPSNGNPSNNNPNNGNPGNGGPNNNNPNNGNPSNGGPSNNNSNNGNPGNGDPSNNPGNNTQQTPTGYDGILAQVRSLTQRNNYQQAVQILNQAIQEYPNRPEAYDALGEIQLYNFNQIGPAVQNYKQSLALGGVATFHVAHDHNGSNFTTVCRGWLKVSRNSVSFEGFDSLDRFRGSRAQVYEAKKNRFQGAGLHIPGVNSNARDLEAFHIRLQNKDGPNYNLAPLSNYKEQETKLILDIIDKD